MNCLLCHSEVIQPVITPCGHIYCWSCLREKLPCPCPFCGKEIWKETLVSLYTENGSTAFENERNEFEERRPEQHYEYVQERPSLLRHLRTLSEQNEQYNLMTKEEKEELFSLPQWFVILLIVLLCCFMAYIIYLRL